MSTQRTVEAFHHLPVEQQAVLQLARSGSSYRRIAERLGLRPNEVSALAAQAMRALAAARAGGVRSSGGASPPGPPRPGFR